ncbi:hypothetical protein V865_005025 [Kwoniella europaea PYCC6329]|uniref:Uncharacterized protein n=1 Tax=Kwoniella europaea PYCC6329 TaxID=1423913 RepID=A0AAX4KLA0_9TREE
MSTQIQSTPISDSFVNAKAQSSRRVNSTSYDMNGSRRGSSTLAVVPENHSHDHHHNAQPSPSSSSAPSSSQPQKVSSRKSSNSTPSVAGDLREMDKALEMKMRRSHSSTSASAIEKGKSKESPGQQQRQRSKRADWVIDLLETQRGAESWIDDQRVILVLGDPTPASLAPILYDPAFSDTLLLVGSSTPKPDIEALLSPSHLMSSTPDQQIFPTVQPFTPSGQQSGDTESHALAVLLSQATALAQQFRARSSIFARSRAESFASTGSGSNSPKRVFTGLSNPSSNRTSIESTNSTSNDRQQQRSVSMFDTSTGSADSTPKAKNRLSSFSILGGLRRNSESFDITPSSSIGASSSSSATLKDNLFDAIINFVPEMKNFKPERCLQDMLHQSVVITTGIVPLLTAKSTSTLKAASKKESKSTSTATVMPISLIHVLPKLIPTPLPNVIESFLLSLLPTFQYRCSREIFGCVTTTQTWLSPFVLLKAKTDQGEEDVSGAQVLLFGGVRCPFQVLDEEEGQCKPRAFLAGWSGCLNMPGLINESRNPSSTSTSKVTSQYIKHTRQLSTPSPASIPYDSVKARTPPQSRSSSPSPSSQKGRLPRSASMPIPNNITNTATTRRSRLHVSHTPPMMSDGELPDHEGGGGGTSPPTPDLDSSIESSRASSIALAEAGRRGSENDNEEIKIVNTNTNSTGSEGSHTHTQDNTGTGTGKGKGTLGNTKKGNLKSWFKRK